MGQDTAQAHGGTDPARAAEVAPEHQNPTGTSRIQSCPCGPQRVKNPARSRRKTPALHPHPAPKPRSLTVITTGRHKKPQKPQSCEGNHSRARGCHSPGTAPAAAQRARDPPLPGGFGAGWAGKGPQGTDRGVWGSGTALPQPPDPKILPKILPWVHTPVDGVSQVSVFLSIPKPAGGWAGDQGGWQQQIPSSAGTHSTGMGPDWTSGVPKPPCVTTDPQCPQTSGIPVMCPQPCHRLRAAGTPQERSDSEGSRG